MKASPIGNSKLISRVNSRLVLQAVRVMQPTYRAAIARQTGLTPATVTSIVNGLINQQLLREVPGEADDAVRWGRPPMMLEVNGDGRMILAVDLEPDRIRVALTNIILQMSAYREQPIDRFSQPELVVGEILKLCAEVLGGVGRGMLQGVGVSLPGLVDRERGVLISSTNMPNWRGVPIAAMLRKHLGLSVKVQRSIHLAALYEKWSNPQSNDRTILIISVRTGIGMSLMYRGELYTGQGGLEGEIGHTVVDLDGPACECGNRGCLETYVSAGAICALAREKILTGECGALRARVESGEHLRPELIYRLAREGDPECAQIVRHIGRYLGIAVANMINLLAPDEVVVCGSIDQAGELLLDAMRDQVERAALRRSRQGVVLRLAREQEKLPLLGAAVLVAQELFQLPRLSHGTFDEPRHAGNGRARASAGANAPD